MLIRTIPLQAISIKSIAFRSGKEKEAERVNSPGHFLYVTASRRSAQMTVYDITSDSTYTTTRHTFNKEEWQGNGQSVPAGHECR